LFGRGRRSRAGKADSRELAISVEGPGGGEGVGKDDIDRPSIEEDAGVGDDGQ
jgi:hypothetical protein